MILNREEKPNSSPPSDSEVIDISSDSEDDLFCQPHRTSREEKPSSSPGSLPSDSEVIEISSDSEDDLFCQPHRSKCRTIFEREDENNAPGGGLAFENDVIELTDSESNNSDLPDLLSPLVKKSRGRPFGGSRGQQPLVTKLIPLYADASDDEESDKDCILVLNDPPGSRKPIRTIPSAKGVDLAGMDQGLPRGNLLLDSAKKNAVTESSQAAQKSPSKKLGHSAYKAKEQARRQAYATELFTELNRDVFGDRLPKDTTLEWSKRLLTTAGRARWHRSREDVHTTKIELASKILDCDERIRNTLSHEMCHLACWVIDNQPREGHGQLFKSWANKVMHEHPDIHISTRHNYEISYPYEWKCEKCSKIYGRYSKSIRPNECVCGACKAGKLIPLFAERKLATPRVGRMAVARPRDSPHSIVRSPKLVRNTPFRNQSPPPSADVNEDITDLVNILEEISIGNTTDPQCTF